MVRRSSSFALLSRRVQPLCSIILVCLSLLIHSLQLCSLVAALLARWQSGTRTTLEAACYELCRP